MTHALRRSLGLLALALVSGCAVNRVSFETTPEDPASRLRSVRAEQRLCEVDRQLALFSEPGGELWLSCPYRYQGRIVPALSYVGPKAAPTKADFTYDEVAHKLAGMTRETLRPCGKSRFCADLSRHGLLDFVVEVGGERARIRYLDATAGLADVQRFYVSLAQPQADAPTLPAALHRLVDAARVADQVRRIDNLAQLARARGQIQASGLQDMAAIHSAVQLRQSELEIEAHRRQGGFAGYQAAYRLSAASSDLDAMKQHATLPAEKSAVFAVLADGFGASRRPELVQEAERYAATPADLARLDDMRKVLEQDRLAEQRRQEEARQAEVRRQEVARVAEQRRQEAARVAEQQARAARAAEERCLSDPACRAAVEERKAACVRTVQSCRQGCDRATGSGSFSSFTSNLIAAAMARTCYAGCKCDTSFGDLVTKFNERTTGTTANSKAPAAAAGSSVADRKSAQPRTYECRIFCKSATGPVIHRRLQANTRADAAKAAGARADEFCAAQGHTRASTIELAESQCTEK